MGIERREHVLRCARGVRAWGAAVAGLILSQLVPAPAGADGQPVEAAGFVFEQTDAVPYDAAAARRSLARMAEMGADTVAFVPFVWQAEPAATDPVPGSAVKARQLRAGIRAAEDLGLRTVVKPHIWISGSWAGAVAPQDGDGWPEWFEAYAGAIEHYARIADSAGADVFFVGTELRHSLDHRAEWRRVIARVEAAFRGRLGYAAHGLDDFRRVPFWDALDIAGVTLYPPLDGGLRRRVKDTTDRLARAAHGMERPVWVAELGIRSAEGSLPRPWESPGERQAKPDPWLQARVLGTWLAELCETPVSTVLVYRWFTDPGAGGLRDTDFTPQNKPAEGVLHCAWSGHCLTAR